MPCDMCGKEGSLFIAEIEDSKMQVCKECSQYGKNVRPVVKPRVESLNKIKVPQRPEIMQIIVAGYAKIIRDAREKSAMKQEDFAKSINEKVSVIHHIETGKAKPSLELARKLEKALRVTLIEQYEDSGESVKASKSENLTIGDMISFKKK